MSKKIINVVINGVGGQPVNLLDIAITPEGVTESPSLVSYGTISSDVYYSIENASKIDIFFIFGDSRNIIIPSTKIKILDGKHYFVGVLEQDGELGMITTVISNNEIKQYVTTLN